MDASTLDLLSVVSFILGFVSVLGSIGVWYLMKAESSESKAHAERFGIFVGLWAPTFFALAIFLRLIARP